MSREIGVSASTLERWRADALASGQLGGEWTAAGYNLRWLMRQIAFLRAWLRTIMQLMAVERSEIVGAMVR